MTIALDPDKGLWLPDESWHSTDTPPEPNMDVILFVLYFFKDKPPEYHHVIAHYKPNIGWLGTPFIPGVTLSQYIAWRYFMPYKENHE